MCRRAALATLLVVVASLGAASSAQAESASLLSGHHGDSARAVKSVCKMPTLICSAGSLVGIGGDVGGAAVGAAGDVAGDAIGGAADSVMNGVVSWAADGAAWLILEVTRQIDRSSRPALGSAWFSDRYAGMTELAVSLVAVFLLLAIGQAIVRQDLSRLLRAVLVALPLALLLTFAAVTLVQLGLALTDAMTATALRGTGDDVRKAFHGLGDLLANPAAPGLAPFVLFLSALVTSMLALIVWLELVMREAAVYVAVAFLPLTLAGLVWEHASSWSRRLAEWLLAIVLAKFTIGASFAIAASAIVDAPKGGGGLSALLAGCAVLAIAALTPLTLLKLLPFAESAAGKSLSRGHVTGAVGALPGAATATFAARQLVLRNFGRAGGAPTAPRSAAASPPDPPTRKPPDLPKADPPRRPPARPRSDS